MPTRADDTLALLMQSPAAPCFESNRSLLEAYSSSRWGPPILRKRLTFRAGHALDPLDLRVERVAPAHPKRRQAETGACVYIHWSPGRRHAEHAPTSARTRQANSNEEFADVVTDQPRKQAFSRRATRAGQSACAAADTSAVAGALRALA